MRRTLPIVATLIAAALAAAGDKVVINLKDVRIKNDTDQHRDSKPDTIGKSFAYHYEITGKLKGESGLFKALYPDPTSLEDILEGFQEGSSQYLKGDGYNPSGELPVEVLGERFEGEQEYGGFTLTFGVTFSGGIDTDGIAYFDATDVVVSPSWLIGTAKFTEGSVTIVRIPVVTGDLNWDGNIDFNDIDPFILALVDPEGYKAEFGYDAIFAGDVNRDEALDFNDIDGFIELLIG